MRKPEILHSWMDVRISVSKHTHQYPYGVKGVYDDGGDRDDKGMYNSGE